MGRADPEARNTVDAQVAADFAAMGAQIEIDAEPEPALEVHEDNWPALKLFLDCATQWRVISGMQLVWLGLDYVAVDVVMRRGGYDDAAFAGLRVMERAALEVMHDS